MGAPEGSSLGSISPEVKGFGDTQVYWKSDLPGTCLGELENTDFCSPIPSILG